MPRLQVLRARTPCCGRIVRLRPSSEGKTFQIVCPHFPDGRKMTVVRDGDHLACQWEIVERWIVQVVLPNLDDVEKRFVDYSDAEEYVRKIQKQFPKCTPLMIDTSA